MNGDPLRHPMIGASCQLPANACNGAIRKLRRLQHARKIEHMPDIDASAIPAIEAAVVRICIRSAKQRGDGIGNAVLPGVVRENGEIVRKTVIAPRAAARCNWRSPPSSMLVTLLKYGPCAWVQKCQGAARSGIRRAKSTVRRGQAVLSG